MSDNPYADWGDYTTTPSSAPTSDKGEVENPYADWGDPRGDEEKIAARNAKPEWLDAPKQLVASVAEDVGAAGTAAQVAAEKAGYRKVSEYARGLSTAAHEAGEYVDSTISDAGKRRRDAALIPGKDQEQLLSHPVDELAMKGVSAGAPAAFGYAGGALGAFIGGLVGNLPGAATGAVTGTAAAGALYQYSKGLDQAVAWTNRLDDNQLSEQAPVFGKFKDMYLKEGMSDDDASYHARAALHEGLFGLKQAAMHSAFGALSFGAGRKVLSGAFGEGLEKRLADYALTGSALGATAAAGDITAQNTENVKNNTSNFDLGKTTVAFLNGWTEGVLFHGAGEAAHKLASFSRPATQAVTEKSEAPSTGAAPKTTRADTQPPPNESAQAGEVGNTVNPPTRDQEPATQKEAAKGAKAKATGKRRASASEQIQGSVDIAPDQQVALNESTAGAPDVTQLVKPEQPAPIPETPNTDSGGTPIMGRSKPITWAEPSITSEVSSAPPVGAQKAPPRPEVTREEADAAIRDGIAKLAQMRREERAAQPEVENPQNILAADEPPEAQNKLAARELPDEPRQGRILEDIDNDKIQQQWNDQIKANLEEAAPEAATGSKRSNAAIEARRRSNEIADNILAKDEYISDENAERNYFDGKAPGSKEARAAIVARAQRMVADAEAQMQAHNDEVLKANPETKPDRLAAIPKSVKDNTDDSMNHNAAMTLLAEAKRLANLKVRTSKDYQRFISRELAARSGDREGIVAERRQEGDAAFRKDQGDVEAPMGKVADALSDNTTPEELFAQKEENDTSAEVSDNFDERLKNATERKSELPGIGPKVREKLEKVQKLAEKGSTEGERSAAQAAIERVKAAAAANVVTVGKDKAGTFKQETKTRRPITRPKPEDKKSPFSAADEKLIIDDAKSRAEFRGDNPEQHAAEMLESHKKGFESLKKDEPDLTAEEYMGRVKSGMSMMGSMLRDKGAKDLTDAAKRASHALTPDELGAWEKENRDTGEREGHVSAETGNGAASAPIKRTATVKDILGKDVLPKKDDSFYSRIFNHIHSKLGDIVGHVEVHYISPEDMARIHKQGERAVGFYKEKSMGEGGYIVLRDDIPKSKQAHAVIHEALHAATSDALSASKELTAKVSSIMKEVKAQFPELEKRYGFTDEHEFIAEAFSNPDFQAYLTQVKVSPQLARSLKLPELTRQPLWKALVQIVREHFGMERGTYTALEALMRPTHELMSLYGKKGMGRQARALTFEDIQKSVDTTNLKNIGRKVLRATQTNTMIAHSAAKFGAKFGEQARKAAELSQRMDVERSKLLDRGNDVSRENDIKSFEKYKQLVNERSKINNDPAKVAELTKLIDAQWRNLVDREVGGLQIAREAADLARKNKDKFRETTELGFEATELNIDPTKDLAWHEKHLGKDATKGWQGKKRLADIAKRFEDLKKSDPEMAAWLERAAKFGRDEGNAQSKELIKSVLETAEVYDPGLADRIFNDGVSEADAKLFETNKIVDHLNKISGLKKMEGWYFPLMREGDYVVTARKEFATPAGKHVTRIDDSTVQFMDPRGLSKGKDSARARKEAKKFVENHDLLHRETKKVFVDANDPTKIVDETDLNARPAYRVQMQDKYMSMHGSERESNTAADDLKSRGYKDIKPALRRDNPNARWGGLMPSQMETLIRSLSSRDKFKNLDKAKQNELVQALTQASIQLLPGNRLQQRNLHRENVEGYSKNLVNSISRYAQTSAAFRARVKYQSEIDAAIHGLKSEIDTTNDKHNVMRGEIANVLETRLYRGQEFQAPTKLDEALGALNKFSLLDKLAGPSFHIINSMEVGTTTGPVLAGRHGVVNTVRTLKNAYNMIGARQALFAGLKDTKKALTQDVGFTDYRKMFQDEIAGNVSGEHGVRLFDLIDHLHDLNLFGHEAGMEVQRLAKPADAGWERALDRGVLMFRQVGQSIEAINRAVTGIAAYELEFKRNKGNHQAAMDYAHDVVHDTMGNYSASNAAPIFNNPIGKSALQFKKFAQKTYYLLGKLASKSLAGDREAQRQFAGVMFTHAVMAGTLGLPLEPIKIALMASGALGGYSYDDFESAVREAAAGLLGKTGGMALTRGIPRALGVDFAGRTSLASLLTFGAPMSNKTNDIKVWLIDTIAGAPLGMLFKGYEAIQAAAKGDVEKTIDNLVPIKAVRDIARAGFGYVGGKLDRNGRQLSEPYSASEAAIQAMGFTPSRKAEEYEERSHFNQQKYERKSERSSLMKDWVTATPEGKAKALTAIQQYNRDVPKAAQITMKLLHQQLKSRQTEKAKGTYDRGMRITKQDRDIYQKSQSIYGN